MVFSSLTFIFIFLPAVLVVYALIHPKLKNALLFAASILFYAYGTWRYTWLLLGEIAVNWYLGLRMDALEKDRKRERALLLALAVCVDLGILVYFKYAGFILRNLTLLTGHRFPKIRAALPIGISFYTFQAISYVADVYRGKRAQKNPVNLGLYLAFFPQLIAGPIVRYQEIEKQLVSRRSSFDMIADGACTFCIGLCMKVLLADQLAVLADFAFQADRIADRPCIVLWLGALAYALQIYFDFAGYSKMAIGLGSMFGFKLPVNFNAPYLAATGTDFWRRWHISLSAWFRDYVYIPLGGNRRGDAVTIRNLAVVWLLTGIWHGAGWTFILWGVLWGALLILERFVIRPDTRGRAFGILYRCFTILWAVLLWMLFRSESLGAAAAYLRGLIPGLGAGITFHEAAGYAWYFRDTLLYLVIGAAAAVRLPQRWLSRVPERTMLRVVAENIGMVLLVVMTLLCVSRLAGGAYNPFLYFNF